MTQDNLHEAAQRDTPSHVEVPNTMAGLLVWAFTKFGTNLTIAMICLIAVSAAAQTVYDDLKTSNQTVIQVVREQAAGSQVIAQAIRDQSTVNQNLGKTLAELSDQVENNTRAISDAKREADFRHSKDVN